MTMEQELISIREAARRLGVSDTALHKARKAGRIHAANPGEKVCKLAWPQVQTDFAANSEVLQQRKPAPAAPATPAAADFRREGEVAEMLEADDDDDEDLTDGSPDYYKSRARKTRYLAKIARLEYEQKHGRLVDAEEVARLWAKQITAAKTRILGIPASCKSRVADLPMPVLAEIEKVCREVLEGLANGSD